MGTDPLTSPAPSLPPVLGARWHGTHATVAVPVSSDVTRVDVCVFRGGHEERHSLRHHLGGTWWGSLSTTDLAPGDRYGLRVTGPEHDPAKLLCDPWALAMEGTVDWRAGTSALVERNGHDSAPFVPRCVLADTAPEVAAAPTPLRRPWSETILYEVHVKGATARHPHVPPAERGTYRGFAHPAFVGHLQRLGITAVELLPMQHHVSEPHLGLLGLTNYWGYNTLGFLAPHAGYATAPAADVTTGATAVGQPHQLREFQEMVHVLHAAGIEVILDIVLNHSAEGRSGLVSWRGLDPRGWYHDHDTTGCGNTFDLTHPPMLRLALDALRWWVTCFGVDGFRFDLSTALGRTRNGYFSPHTPFFQAIAQDPLLSTVKMIAEPWDVGHAGYQLGHHPAGWAEWNDRYRDTMRDHWNDAHLPRGDVASRLAGSRDIFGRDDRPVWSSINFVTAHDGFTLADLVSFEHKHNEANGEGNADGSGANRSINHGVEGASDDVAVQASRFVHRVNLLASLLLSLGTPMLLGGDELGRTQQGNNNAYCQDNELSWFDWEHADDGLIAITAQLVHLRKELAEHFSRGWLDESEASWFDLHGTHMSIDAWRDPEGTGLSLLVQGEQPLLFLFHEGAEAVDCVLPRPPSAVRRGTWEVLMCTAPEWTRRDRSPARTTIVTLAGPAVLVARFKERR